MKVYYDWKHFVNTYRKYVKKDFLVLEIGASSQEKTKELAKFCKNLIGVEIMPERTPVSFKNVKYITGDWEKLTEFVKKKSIDLAVAAHVIEHVRNDRKALRELYRLLKPGGVAILNTPNRIRLTRRILEVFFGERKFPYGEHLREYSEEDLKRLLSASPFKKYSIEPVVFGIHTKPILFYIQSVPRVFRGMANFWEITLFK